MNSLGKRSRCLWLYTITGAITGLISVFPMFYVNWSRYPQLAGIALVPVAWMLLLAPKEPPEPDASG